MNPATDIYQPVHNVRIVTATALFDGHDASINIMRRILQDTGVEVIHLGHNRSVREIVKASIEEDVQGIAVSSYQGGHVEFFKYMIDLLAKNGAGHIKVFGGGGGVIIPDEIRQLEAYGVARIYTPEDGATLGLQGIVNHLVEQADFSLHDGPLPVVDELSRENRLQVARLITVVEASGDEQPPSLPQLKAQLKRRIGERVVPVIGITGTGGSGKSSLTDEVVLRQLRDLPQAHIAVISCDPSRRKSGGALLGDRIRMNAIDNDRVYMRSLATRRSNSEISARLPEVIDVVKAAGYDLVLVETAGIGQGNSNIIDLADLSVYVMTPEFGAASQLEKIDMLDYADLIAVNKYEKRGAEDAVRDVRKQVQRNRRRFDSAPDEMPVFGTIASKFNDDGVNALYLAMMAVVAQKIPAGFQSTLPRPAAKTSSSKAIIIPPQRTRYLSEISDAVRDYHRHTESQARALRGAWHLKETADMLSRSTESPNDGELIERLKTEIAAAETAIEAESIRLLEDWEKMRARYAAEELVYTVRGEEIRTPLTFESLSHLKLPKVKLPDFKDPADLYSWLRNENLPGYFPFTAGVYPLKRLDEASTRMFAGEGGPARTNRRFRLLSADDAANRLSTAFDSVTLYGQDPDRRPDIYGKVGTSGVSICSLDDVKILYEGFDLCDPKTSVSMTINGPAPIILAMFLNTAIDQQIEKFAAGNGRPPSAEEADRIRAAALSSVRGTVQADILKEDQGQNTCIFSIEFALKMMGDVQDYFITHQVRNFYSVSISGYHIAEAGANPITQLALTLANGFTYVEYYLSRGMPIDSFAPNLSFFFSNGMEPEYTVIGRVARRVWAVAMAEKYGAATRSQMLKYHIQTSGRSLHSQDIQFNDIRTTLQALCAIYDNCNSLHTNAFDEAITTPSRESVRRALAIQMIINREWGLARNENRNQGSFIVDELTRLVEEAVLMEFDRITERGGVLGAMETGYQRSKIQEESLFYETLKHEGRLPIIGVNTFRDPDASQEELAESVDLARATPREKEAQIARLEAFHERHAEQAPEALRRLQQAALNGDNIFAELMAAVRCCSLGQIAQALYDVGGKYRRNM